MALNVTVTESQAAGYLTVYPCGSAVPGAANLTYAPQTTVANSVVAKVGTGGKVCIFTLAAAHVVVDVAGWFPASTEYTPVAPQRLLETRSGEPYPTVDGAANGVGRCGRDSVTELQVIGRAGVGARTSAVVLNLAVVWAAGGGVRHRVPVRHRSTAGRERHLRGRRRPVEPRRREAWHGRQGLRLHAGRGRPRGRPQRDVRPRGARRLLTATPPGPSSRPTARRGGAPCVG